MSFENELMMHLQKKLSNPIDNSVVSDIDLLKKNVDIALVGHHFDIISNNFNWKRVHKTMTFLDWKWIHSDATYKVPTIADMKISCYESFISLIDEKSHSNLFEQKLPNGCYKYYAGSNSGGFRKEIFVDKENYFFMSLEFILNDWESYEDNQKPLF